jgi:hypothetical protein
MSRSAVWWENHLWRSQLPCIPDWGLLFICYQIPIIFFFLCHASPKSSCWYICYIFILSSGSTCSPPPVDNKLSHTSSSILTLSASDCFNHGNPSHTAVDEMKTIPHRTVTFRPRPWLKDNENAPGWSRQFCPYIFVGMYVVNIF